MYRPYASDPPYGYPATRRTNSLAIAALVASFVFWPAGLVLGHVARRQIARSDESGRGLATAALVIAYLHFALIALLIVVGVASG
jgi:short subunit fatty acids transporter